MALMARGGRSGHALVMINLTCKWSPFVGYLYPIVSCE